MRSMEDLCNALIRADSEDEVLTLLKEQGVWEDSECWRPLGERENNWATVNNQASDSLGALTELLINGLDAVLTRKCWEENINPEDHSRAPKSIHDAAERYFGIKRGQLSDLSPQKRTELAEKVCGLVATGSIRGRRPCYGIYDLGEGQKPEDFEETFLSLGASNKIKTHFVQGKYCQGSHGVLRHCGKNGFKLIVSKSFADENQPNGCWGFSILRKREPKSGERVSVAEYLVIDNKIPKFPADKIFVIPSSRLEPYGAALTSGTYVKLYEYDLPPGSPVTLDFNYRLGAYLTAPALPIRIFETRKFEGHTLAATFMGLSERLKGGPRIQENIEEGFPVSGPMHTKFGELSYSIFVLKKSVPQSRYAQDHGVILSVNGQKHASHPRSWFGGREVELSNLRNSLICLIDCSKIESAQHENLFKSSRDRMDANAKNIILNRLAVILKESKKIRDLKNRRREEEIADKLKDNKVGQNLTDSIIKKFPIFREFLNSGGRIPAPFPDSKKIKKEFIGKRHPSYFRLDKEFPTDAPKIAEIGRQVRIQFKTDVEDNYLGRDNHPGRFSLCCNELPKPHYHINTSNGIWTLNLTIPSDLPLHTKLAFEYWLTDETLIEPFQGKFYLQTQPRKEIPPPPPQPRLQIKPPMRVVKSEWADHNMDEKSALIIKHHEGQDWDFYYNADNVYLKTYMKNIPRSVEVLEQQFSLGLQFLALGYIAENRNGDPNKIEKTVESFTRGAAAAILVVIDALSAIEETGYSEAAE